MRELWDVSDVLQKAHLHSHVTFKANVVGGALEKQKHSQPMTSANILQEGLLCEDLALQLRVQ